MFAGCGPDVSVWYRTLYDDLLVPIQLILYGQARVGSTKPEKVVWIPGSRRSK
jgi:hypothetical protein